MKGPTIPRPLTATAVVLITLTLTACGVLAPATGPASEPTAQTPTSAPAPVPEALVSDPDDVADTVAREFWATDTRTDTTPTDAATRTARWLTPAYTAIATQTLPGGAGADWIKLAEHHGHTTVTVAIAAVAGGDGVPDRPADTTTTATRVRILTLTPTGADGWIGEPQHLVATLALTRAGDTDPWLVNAITVDQSLVGMPEGDTQDFG